MKGWYWQHFLKVSQSDESITFSKAKHLVRFDPTYQNLDTSALDKVAASDGFEFMFMFLDKYIVIYYNLLLYSILIVSRLDLKTSISCLGFHTPKDYGR